MSNLLGGGLSTPNFQQVDLTQGEKNTGAAVANNFTSRNLGTSTMETQAEAGNVLNFSTRQAEENLKLADLAQQDQNIVDQQSNSSLSQLAGLAGFIGL